MFKNYQDHIKIHDSDASMGYKLWSGLELLCPIVTPIWNQLPALLFIKGPPSSPCKCIVNFSFKMMLDKDGADFPLPNLDFRRFSGRNSNFRNKPSKSRFSKFLGGYRPKLYTILQLFTINMQICKKCSIFLTKKFLKSSKFRPYRKSWKINSDSLKKSKYSCLIDTPKILKRKKEQIMKLSFCKLLIQIDKNLSKFF